MPRKPRVLALLTAIVAVVTALALQVTSVRAVWCARADLVLSGARADAEPPEGGVDALDHGADGVAADRDHGTCVSSIVLAPGTLSTFAFPGASEVTRGPALLGTRRIPCGLERPPRLA